MTTNFEPREWPFPSWVGPKTELLAATADIVSKHRFRVWYDRVEANRPGRRLRRARRRPLLVEDVEAGAVVARLATWAQVTDWHDEMVISTGWRLLTHLPEVAGLADYENGAPNVLEPHSSG